MMKFKAFHTLSYGLYLVTSADNGKNAGYVANTVFQVTSEPPQVAISCHKNNDTCSTILKSGIFAVSVLKKDASASLIGEFGFMASSEVDKFRKINFQSLVTGAPVVSDSCIAWFDCKVVNTLDVGSHMLFIGEVAGCDVTNSDEDPLTYAWYREKFRMLAPKNAPTHIDKSKLEAEEEPVPVVEASPGKETGKSEPEEYYCTICGFRYNPEEGDPTMGIQPGTPFDDLPEDYRCPICNASKEYFREG